MYGNGRFFFLSNSWPYQGVYVFTRNLKIIADTCFLLRLHKPLRRPCAFLAVAVKAQNII
jgi:hypothetical protein